MRGRFAGRSTGMTGVGGRAVRAGEIPVEGGISRAAEVILVPGNQVECEGVGEGKRVPYLGENAFALGD